MEDSESWDMECLRTPLGGWVEGVKEDGEFRMYKGMTESCWDSPVASITWLLVRLSEDMDPSVRRERGVFSAVCVSYNKQHLTWNKAWHIWLCRVLGCPDLCLSLLHHVFSLFEAPHPATQLTDAVSFCWGALCSSALSCSEYLQAADENS